MYRNVLLLVLVVCFSILHKAVSFSVRVFDGSLLLYILCWSVVLLILYRVLDSALAAVFSGLFLLHFGDLQDALYGFSKFLGSTWFLLAVYVAIIVLIIVLNKKGRVPYRFNYYLFILFTALTLLELARGVATLMSPNRLVAKPARTTRSREVPAKPDIYYLMFDSYTSNAVLQKHWGFRNDVVSNFLRSRSFMVSDSAKSLYDFTPAAVISTFNFDYLQLNGRKALSPDVATFNVLRREFADNRLFSFLKNQGYEISVRSMLTENNNLNEFFPFVPEEPLHWLRRRTIEKLWLNPAMLQRIKTLTGSKDTVPARIRNSTINMHRYNNDVLHTVQQQPRSNKPAFLFAHFFVPHIPPIYDKDGSLRSNSNFPATENMTRYIDQVNYANKLIMQCVQQILQEKPNSIIIIQGDHGYRQYDDTAARADRFGIMNAIYLPGMPPNTVGNDFLSVNTFRVVLNGYFGQSLPLLKAQ